MEEEGGSAATKLPMCNCGKPSAVKMPTTEKKTLVGDFGVVRDGIYMKIKIQICNVSKLKYKDEMWKTIKVQGPQNGFCLDFILKNHQCKG